MKTFVTLLGSDIYVINNQQEQENWKLQGVTPPLPTPKRIYIMNWNCKCLRIICWGHLLVNSLQRVFIWETCLPELYLFCVSTSVFNIFN